MEIRRKPKQPYEYIQQHTRITNGPQVRYEYHLRDEVGGLIYYWPQAINR